ncbi:hypothetical protein BTM25_37170 [Actinomadura rubteroloni]|uniref:Uncharacterized protein n=1 Tax=Actinomadura rubteroloni TaxID=1926885 RepID=A0A2P4UJ36_9ACTN|nr:hypothetical protein [Actinomadura rubteroloni]POM25075.1 hypothetical protein BTM25_37170 [Actinomadura rubteroloni]
MRFRKPVLVAATAAAALLPVAAVAAPAGAVPPPAGRIAVQAAPLPSADQLLALVLTAFPANIQADARLILAGDYMNGLQKLVADVQKLTSAQLQDIAAKLLKLLKLLPTDLGSLFGAQLSQGLSHDEALTAAITAALAPRLQSK